VAVVAQQRQREAAFRPEPAPAQHQHVDRAVVVVVGGNHVEPAGLAREAGFARAVLERPVARVAHEPHLLVEAHRGPDEVQAAIAVEVLQHGAPGKAAQVEPGLPRHVVEARKGSSGREHRR
jgi:hypothetical protein